MKEAQGDSAGWKQNTRLRIWLSAKRWTVSWCVQSSLQISLLKYGEFSFQLLPGWQSLPITISSGCAGQHHCIWGICGHWYGQQGCPAPHLPHGSMPIVISYVIFYCRCESCMEIGLTSCQAVCRLLSGHNTQHTSGQKLMRVSAVQDGFVSDIAEHVQVGMQIKARVINVDPGTSKVGLTMRSPESEEARVERQARRAERSERFGGGGERGELGERGQAPVQARMRRAPKGAARACIPGQGSAPVHTAVHAHV